MTDIEVLSLIVLKHNLELMNAKNLGKNVEKSYSKTYPKTKSYHLCK